MSFSLETATALKLILNSARFVYNPIVGVLLASLSNLSNINDSIPISHSVLPLSSVFELALEQIDLYCKKSGKKVVGVYFANENTEDNQVPNIVSKLAQKVKDDHENTLLLMLDFKKLPKSSVFQPFSVVQGVWKPNTENIKVSSEFNDNLLSKHLLEDKTYELISDFDQHLDDISIPWLKNDKLDNIIKNSLKN
ncbi:ER membrane protein complex subunit 8 [Lobulomyces angularis]|nr:ER membrane protein complex subunit 8 [Lobulomyces angularis]